MTALGGGSYRHAETNNKGQYSDAVLSELESQNDEQLAGISGKVKRLKDVCPCLWVVSTANFASS